jgi:hypothetical protein
MLWIGLLVGFFLGGTVGIVAMALVAAGRSEGGEK